MPPRAMILGCGGETLSQWEKDFFREVDPWGFILFARNLQNPGQIRALTAALRETVGRDAPILIDQEGGRVERLGAPHWQQWEPPLDLCARLPDCAARADALALRYRVIAAELLSCGIDVNCAPLADLARPDTHPVLRNRCYGDDPDEVAALALTVAQAQLAGGVLPVVKHLPGQGRAAVDSHDALPEVTTPAATLAASDFKAFRALADLPLAMTAHVVYRDIDAENCATLSARMIALIRDDIGFNGLLMTDDISMQALTGTPGKRATRALAAGCDIILHCNGERAEMQAIAAACPELADDALRRADAALSMRRTAEPFDLTAALAQLNAAAGERLHA